MDPSLRLGSASLSEVECEDSKSSKALSPSLVKGTFNNFGEKLVVPNQVQEVAPERCQQPRPRNKKSVVLICNNKKT